MKCALSSFLSFTEDLLSFPFLVVLPGGPWRVDACLQAQTMMSISDISSLSFNPSWKKVHVYVLFIKKQGLRLVAKFGRKPKLMDWGTCIPYNISITAYRQMTFWRISKFKLTVWVCFRNKKNYRVYIKHVYSESTL